MNIYTNNIYNRRRRKEVQENVNTTYLKNVAKSFGYATADVFKHYNPTLNRIYKSSKEAVLEIKRIGNESKAARQREMVEAERNSNSSSSIIEDLISGRWYNRKIEQEENERYLNSIESGAEDWGDDTTATAVSESSRDIIKNNNIKTIELKDAISGSSSNIADSFGYVSGTSAEYIVANFNSGVESLYNLTSSGFDRVTTALLTINNGINAIAGFNNNLSAHIKNSTVFYINATQKLSNIDTNIEKLVQLQEEKSKPITGTVVKNKYGVENLLDADGNIDLAAYVNMVNENMKQFKEITDMFIDRRKDWTLKYAEDGNLMAALMLKTVESMIPKKTRQAMLYANNTLKDSIVTALTRGGKMAANSRNPVANLLGEIFFPRDGFKEKINTANYNKGPISWDGIARKSLVEVIPTYLAKIYAALGGEEKYFDYEYGKFVKVEQIKDIQNYDKRVAATRAGGKMRSDILQDIRETAPDDKKVILEKEVESFFLQAFMDGYDFVDVVKKINDKDFLKRYGLTKESAKYIVDYITSNDNKKSSRAVEFVANVARTRNEFGNTIRRKEASSTSNLSYIEHNFEESTNKLSNTGFDLSVDKFGKSQAYYLRGIYTMTGNIYGTMLGTARPMIAFNPDNKQTLNSTYFNPDTGKFGRVKPKMVNDVKSNTSGSSAAGGPTIDISTEGSSVIYGAQDISIEDRAKYYGKSDAEIRTIKRREEILKRYNQAFIGEEVNPLNGTDADGNPKPGRFKSALNKAKDIYEAPFAAMTDMINSFTFGINKMLYGTPREEGLIDKMTQKFKSIWDKIFGDEVTGEGSIGIKQAMKNEYEELKNKAKEKLSSKFGNIFARDKAMRDREMAEAVYDHVTGNNPPEGNARGRRITKTGLIAVSEGELVIPSELNPYYNKKTDKKDQIRKENNVIDKFYGSFATGGTVGDKFAEYRDGKFDIVTDPETGARKYVFVKADGTVIDIKEGSKLAAELAQEKIREAGKRIEENTGLFTTVADGASLLGSNILKMIKISLFGTEKQQEEDKKKINIQITDVIKEINKEKGAMGIGAIGGLGVSLLTGAVVGPIAGVAIGAGVGLLAKSEKMQKALFGEPDEDGNYDSNIKNFIMKNVPKASVGSGIGLVGGALLGSPIAGLIVGSAIGFAGQSETVKDALFGMQDDDDNRSIGGIINKDLRDKIKKAVPNISAGALAGMLVGPFGIVGNILVGSAVGYASTGQKFHDYFFSEDEKNPGLAHIIHDKIVNNIDDLFHNTSNAMQGWLKKTGSEIGIRLKNIITRSQAKYRSGEGNFIEKAIGWAATVPGQAIKKGTNLIGDTLGGLANARRSRNLAKGYDVWNAKEKRNATAAERLEMRSENDISTAAAVDRMIAGASADQLKELRQTFEDMRRPDAKYKQTRNRSIATLYSELINAGVDNKKFAERLSKELGSSNSTIRMEDLIKKYNIDQDKQQAVRLAFDKADKTITKAKDFELATEGNMQMLQDKYGINFNGRPANAAIENYLSLIDHDQKIRFGDKKANKEAKVEEYQDTVVNVLSDVKTNTGLIAEFTDDLRTILGRYDAQVDQEGNIRFFRHGMSNVTGEEAHNGMKEQRDFGEFSRDAKDTIAETASNVVTAVSEPVKEGITATFDFLNTNVATPLLDTVKSISETAKQLYQIGVKGYNEENPEITLDKFYGPKSRVDIVNDVQRTATRAKYFGRRLKRGVTDVINYSKENDDIQGKAAGGPADSSETFFDKLVDKLLDRASGSRATSSNEQQRTHIDMFGNVHQMTTNKQGETVEVVNDNETKKSRAIMNKFIDSVNVLPQIGTAVTGLGGAMSFIKDKLFGNKESEPGILTKMLEGMFDKAKGFFPALAGFLTGKTIGGFFGGMNIYTLFLKLIGPALVTAGLGGKLDQVVHEVTGGSYGSPTMQKGFFRKDTGEEVFKTQDGKYVDKNGNEVDPALVEVRKTDVGTFSDKLKENFARNTLLGKSSVVSKAFEPVTRAVTGALSGVAGKVSNVIQNGSKVAGASAAEKAQAKAVRVAFTEEVSEGIMKFCSKLKAVPMLKNIDFDGLSVKLSGHITKALTTTGLKEAGRLAANFVIWAKLGFVVVDFMTGYQDARTTLGIVDKPSIGQRVLSGLIRAIKNFIPVVGTLIPDALLVDIFCGFIAPVFQIDIEDLKSKRGEALTTVQAYNNENGTDLTLEQYNKKVLGDYTITEKIGNKFLTLKNKFDDTKNKILGKKDPVNQYTSEVSEEAGKGLSGVVDTVKGYINDSKNAIKSGFASGKIIIARESSNLEQFLDTSYYRGNEKNPMNGINKGLYKTARLLSFPILLMTATGKDISEKFDGMVAKVTGAYKICANNNEKISALAKQGKINEIWENQIVDDQENPLNGIYKVVDYGQKLAGTFVGSFHLQNNRVKDLLDTSGINSDISTFKTASASIKAFSKSGNIKSIWGLDVKFSETNPISGLFSFGIGVNKVLSTVPAFINSIFDTVGNFIDDIKEGAKNSPILQAVMQSINDAGEYIFGTGKKKINSTNGNYPGSQYDTGGDSGFVSQYDPKYQNYQVSGKNFAEKGCGPAVAAMAGKALGKNISVEDAVNGSQKYQNDGGVSIDYFQNMLGSKGINTRYISGSASQEMYNSIANGEKVVLLGRDPKNTSKERSPFGPNNHYVLATGLDRKGNVIVNDPESNKPKVYDKSILNSANYGVATSKPRNSRRLFSDSGSRLKSIAARFSGSGSLDPWLHKDLGWMPAEGQAYLNSEQFKIDCQAMNDAIKKQNKNSPFNGRGDVFLRAGLISGLNPSYICAHAALESGWGTSAFAKNRNNYFGIGAYDSNPNMAYRFADGTSDGMLGGITEGAKWIARNYYFNKKHNQKTIYTMRFNNGRHQYATDPEWANKIARTMSNLPNFASTNNAAEIEAFSKQMAAQAGVSTSTSFSTGSIDGTSGAVDVTSSQRFTNIFNVVSDVSSVFTDAFMKTSLGGLNGSTGTTAVDANGNPVVTGSTTVNDKQKALVNKMLEVKDKLKYDMNGPRDPDKGSADCSSTVNWAYMKTLNQNIGNNTQEILSSAATEFIDQDTNMSQNGGSNSKGPDVSKLMPGDLLLYSRPNDSFSKGRPYRVGHVEMYMGDNQRIGHGSTPGPKVTSVTSDSARYIGAKRLKGITAAGSGLMSYSDLARRSGGSSGILMSARPGSRNNLTISTSGKLAPVGSFYGGDTGLILDDTQAMLTNIRNTAINKAQNNGISPELIAKLLSSITQILQNIANNTAPVGKIYQALVAYVQSGGASGIKSDNKNDKKEAPTPIKLDKSKQNQARKEPEIDSSLATLVGVLAELAKG